MTIGAANTNNLIVIDRRYETESTKTPIELNLTWSLFVWM